MKVEININRLHELEDIERKYYRIHPEKRDYPELHQNLGLIYGLHGLSDVLWYVENGESREFSKEIFEKFLRKLEVFRLEIWGDSRKEVEFAEQQPNS